MAGIPPQFLAHAKSKGKGKPDNAAEDAKDGGKDDAQETPNPFAKGNPFAKKGSKDSKKNSKDSKDSKSKGSKAAFLKNVAQKGKF